MIDLKTNDPANPWHKIIRDLEQARKDFDETNTYSSGFLPKSDKSEAPRLTYSEARTNLDKAQEPVAKFLNKLFARADWLANQQEKEVKKDAPSAATTDARSKYDSKSHHHSLFSVWTNYEMLTSKAANGIGDLPALSKEPLSKLDIKKLL